MLNDPLLPRLEQVLDVTALTRLIKRQLEGRFAQIWVRGEISNLRVQSSGHLYFSLKDAGSQLPCAFFASDAARQDFSLEDGMEVLLMGDISVYEPHGRYQLIAKFAIRSGEGRLQLEFERLKRKLATEGLFDADRKQALPLLPRRIALITSPTGAALQDFLRILKRRDFRGEVVVFPARVQGKGAAQEVAARLEDANARGGFDLVVLARGGGSIEDLWAFNEEALARTVATSRLPVVSAIGHEIDHVLTDYAADVRAETPSAAAELISSLYLKAWESHQEAGKQLHRLAERQLRELHQRIEQLQARRQTIAPARQLEMLLMRVDDLEMRLIRAWESRQNAQKGRLESLAHRLVQQHPKMRLKLALQELDNLAARLTRVGQHYLPRQRTLLENMGKRLQNSSLQATLSRGYAILQAEDGRILSDCTSASREASLRARLRDGEIRLRQGN